MGGLTALMLAQRAADRVLSFVNIEGNLAREDCFLSRQIIDNPADDPAVFLEEFAARTHRAPGYSSALYASNVRSRVRPDVVRSVFESMVDLSDHGDLLSRFTALALPRLFMYGEQNAGLSYLPFLREHGVELAEIPLSGHWPMYSNPVA
jgi:pimeloyl-ACP methyl ester carboxylesterase